MKGLTEQQREVFALQQKRFRQITTWGDAPKPKEKN